jgi:hypothetical protein
VPPSERLAFVIAVTGCDGAGKSTLSEDLLSRLAPGMPVEWLYLGQSSGNIAPATTLVIFILSHWRAYKFWRMLRLNRRGVVVITDRYPQAEVPGFHFDGPGLGAINAETWMGRKLAAREQRLYQWMASHVPALLIRLNIDADTAHLRKPDHKLSILRDKVAIIPNLHFNGADILELDGCAPYEQTLSTALSAARAAINAPPIDPA